ncbi:MAG: COX15/CtaA family protein [Pseudomonadota bacterium]|nr:COX15/CtaA family protein [Pseudomonadota bacterium]
MISSINFSAALSRAEPSYTLIRTWLYVCCGLVFAMVLLGGITRLTESGLSMVDWHPVTGWLPPISAVAWADAFDAYRGSPEFQQLNFWMELEDFKHIFWLEYLHRLLGRVIGLIYLLPFLWFLFRYRIPMRLTGHLVFLLALGVAQGGLGWYMVKSGLVDQPSVSHYRLAAHLGLAVFIYGYMLYTAIGISEKLRGITAGQSIFVWPTALIFSTMIWGAFVSGLDGGAVFNTFPLMDGRIIPHGVFEISPIWLNIFENIGLVQWLHRALAIATVAMILAIWWRERAAKSVALNLMAIFAAVQFSLGVLTILSGSSIYIAWAHQGGAMVLFSLAIYLWGTGRPIAIA